MDKLLIEGEGLNKYKALKEKKIRATKDFLRKKGVLHKFPKDKEFWDRFVDWIDNEIRIHG